MRFLLSATALIFSVAAFAKPQFLYAGPTSVEGRLKFSAHVDVASSSSSSALSAGTAVTEADARVAIRKQLLYVIGNMQYGIGGVKGTPSTGYKISNVQMQTGAQSTRISYDVESMVIVDKRTRAGSLKVDLPNDPLAVEKLDRALCNEAADEPMWYGFNPRAYNCPLKEGQDFATYPATLTLKANTTLTYPEYGRLAAHRAIRMDVLLNSEIEHVDPYIQHLLQEGFKEFRWPDAKIVQFLNFTPSEMPVVEEFTRDSLTVRVFYGPARIENLESAKAFHYFYKDALENAGVVIYNGHSGLGSNIDLALIEKNEGFNITLNPDYQLMFLGGCITYSYYTDMYLARKATATDPRGTLNLDILGFGQESPGFDSRPLIQVSRAIEAFAQDGTRMSYQDITSQITYSWFGVVGDEDNTNAH